MKTLLILVPVLFTACKSSEASKGEPCDAAATLAASLFEANGFNMDLTDPKNKEKIEAAKKSILGKSYSFKNCKFHGQGGDQVTLSVTGKEGDTKSLLECVAHGGKEGVTKFRKAGMALEDSTNFKVDFTGTVGLGEHGRVMLLDCKFNVHQ
jgi:hypothetical protein